MGPMGASSPVTDEQLAELHANGYAVVPSVVPQHLLEPAAAAIEEVLQIRADDPASWSRLGDDFRGIVPIWGHQALWDIRQHPPLVAVWRKVWGIDDLWVSLDRCRFQPTGLERGVLPIHWDHDPHDMGRAWFQGVVALTDTAADQGAFRCVPEVYRDRTAWPTTPILGPYGDEWRPDITDRNIVQVPARAGDVIVWDFAAAPREQPQSVAAAPPGLLCHVLPNRRGAALRGRTR